jgi:hypothetical protein
VVSMKTLPSKKFAGPRPLSVVREDRPFATARTLRIGMILFPGLDQMDFTGPFEVFSRLPEATVHVLWKNLEPVEDMRGGTGCVTGARRAWAGIAHGGRDGS